MEMGKKCSKIWKTTFPSPYARDFHYRRAAPRLFVSPQLPLKGHVKFSVTKKIKKKLWKIEKDLHSDLKTKLLYLKKSRLKDWKLKCWNSVFEFKKLKISHFHWCYINLAKYLRLEVKKETKMKMKKEKCQGEGESTSKGEGKEDLPIVSAGLLSVSRVIRLNSLLFREESFLSKAICSVVRWC